jgi:hypothetical protein
MRFVVTSFLLIAASTVASAQALPAPSRSVFKCNVNGKTTYSDNPCLGAERLEIEPSRGVGKIAGSDVQRERHREMFAEAIRPLTGMDAKQLDRQGHRMKLSADAQRECRALDTQVPNAERAASRTLGDQGDMAKTSLFGLRQRQRDLRC